MWHQTINNSFVCCIQPRWVIYAHCPSPFIFNTRTWCHVATGWCANQTMNDDLSHPSLSLYIPLPCRPLNKHQPHTKVSPFHQSPPLHPLTAHHSFLLSPSLFSPSIPLVFAGPVRWTGKKTEIGLNQTAKDRTTGCGCTNSEFFRLPVAMFVEKSKNRKKPV